MKILVYKRTHIGDPDANGCFGISDCMGSVRDRDFDAVIGVGGIGAEAKANGIAGMVNWIGIGPHKTYVGKRGPEVTFNHFVYFGDEGPDLHQMAPILAQRLYGKNVRSVLHGLSNDELHEALEILQLAVDAPPSISSDRGDVEVFENCKRRQRIKCSTDTTVLTLPGR